MPRKKKTNIRAKKHLQALARGSRVAGGPRPTKDGFFILFSCLHIAVLAYLSAFRGSDVLGLVDTKFVVIYIFLISIIQVISRFLIMVLKLEVIRRVVEETDMLEEQKDVD